MQILNLTNPITLILLVVATALLIFLSKELKKPYIATLPLVFFLALVLLHSIQLTNVAEFNNDLARSILLGSIAVDLIMIFVTFFGYLWVDDIACKFYKKKSIDNSMDWFWKQV